ncbi:MAG: GMC oxidoreductase, partial [Candidatus Poseidoniales archaeon]
YFDVNQKSGLRWNTTRAFLRPIKERSNLEIWTHAQVAKLLISSDANGQSHCSGVDVALPNGRISINAHKAVVLSAGAIGTPQILQLSGIGPANLLQKYGITTIVNLPGVGQNLQDHLQIRSVYKVEGVNTLNTLSNSFWGKAKIGMEYAFKRSGPMSMAPSQLGAFTRSSADQTYPNIEYHVQPLSLDAFGEPLHDFPAFTASVCNLNPSSRGEVNITSPDFLSSPDIVPNYLSTEEDRKVAADSLRVTRRIVSQPALEKYKPQEWKPGEQYQSDEELARLAGDIATTIFHPVGTASMGSDDDPLAVLDSKLRVRDGRGGVVHSLRVVDASAMPSITSGNTNSPTLMMAEKAAQWLVA